MRPDYVISGAIAGVTYLNTRSVWMTLAVWIPVVVMFVAYRTFWEE